MLYNKIIKTSYGLRITITDLNLESNIMNFSLLNFKLLICIFVTIIKLYVFRSNLCCNINKNSYKFYIVTSEIGMFHMMIYLTFTSYHTLVQKNIIVKWIVRPNLCKNLRESKTADYSLTVESQR